MKSILSVMILVTGISIVGSKASAESLCRRASLEPAFNKKGEVFTSYELADVQVDNSAKTVKIRTKYLGVKNQNGDYRTNEILTLSFLDRAFLKMAYGSNLKEELQIAEESFVGDSKIYHLRDFDNNNAGRLILTNDGNSRLDINVGSKDVRNYFQGVGACPTLTPN